MRLIILSALGMACTSCAVLAGPLTLGNLVVLQAETDANNGNLNGLGAVARMREFSLSASAFNGNDLLFAADGTGVVHRGNDSTGGHLQRSPDGQYLTWVGYGTASGGDTLATTNRRVVRVDGSFTATTFDSNAHSLGQGIVRSAITNDGVNFYISGSTQGVVRLDTTGGNTSVAGYTSITSQTNLRVAQFGANGADVLVSGTFGFPTSLYVNTIGPGGALSPLVLTTGGFSPNDFQFASSTLLYVARTDNGGGGTPAALERWEYNAGAWTLAYNILGKNLGSIAVGLDAAGNNVIYGTTFGSGGNRGNQLVQLIDVGPSSTYTVLATADSSTTSFRGVDFAVPAPGGVVGFAVAALGMLRRRR